MALIDLPPEPPVIALVDGLRIVVRIAGTLPSSTKLVVDGVEVQQELGSVTSALATAETVELARSGPSERLRLRWMRGGVKGPWGNWRALVRTPASFVSASSTMK